MDENKVCALCKARGITRLVYRVIDGIRMCGGCVADMPTWCLPHLRHNPPEYVKAVAFRGGQNLCKECLDTENPVPKSVPSLSELAEMEFKDGKLAPPVHLPPLPVEPIVKEKMNVEKLCACGCGIEARANGYAWGHKPKAGTASLNTSRTNQAGKLNAGFYEDVLEGLKAKRDKLNAAIEALEGLQ